MHGCIDVETELGKGSAFTLSFDTEISLESSNAIAHSNVAAGSLGIALQRRVLIADDNAVNRRLACKLLEKLGCTAELACHGRQAIEMWRGGQYDLIFMDCHMPELDGYQAVRLIREYESEGHLRRTPIVAMTAQAMQGDRERCLAAGMDDYISKPVKLENIEQTLERWCGVAADR
jgi:CheY-like chemotaxis protein